MEQGEGEANTMHCQYPIALVIRTVHLDVVVAPFLNQLDRHRCLHQPRKHRVEQEYHLHIPDDRIVSCGSSTFGISIIRTANPIRVAMDELQLHDLQNIKAVHGVQYTKRRGSCFMKYLRWMCSRTQDRLPLTSQLFQTRPLGAKRRPILVGYRRFSRE